MNLIRSLCISVANVARELKRLTARVVLLENAPPGSGLLARVSSVNDVPDPIDNRVYLIEESKALAFERNGETCFSPLLGSKSRGIDTNTGFCLADHNGRIVWRF